METGCLVKDCCERALWGGLCWRHRKAKIPPSKIPVPPSDFLTPTEVCQALGISRNTLYKYLLQGRVKALRLGKGRWRIPRFVVEELLQISA